MGFPSDWQKNHLSQPLWHWPSCLSHLADIHHKRRKKNCHHDDDEIEAVINSYNQDYIGFNPKGNGHLSCVPARDTKERGQTRMILPSEGMEVAVGGAASTRISSNNKKLAKMLIATKRTYQMNNSER